ncbi:MAG: PilZ domain-containing protein [Bryobacterales bacterium]|nr:PilZ domain-containing protein [Bryobacterales bacterium]
MIEQRRAKRFELQLPVEVVRAGSERVSRLGRTHNISSGGVLFTSGARLEPGGPVEYVVTLSTGTAGAVNLRCMGKVLRQESSATNGLDEDGYTVAVSLERYEFMRSSRHSS